MPQLRHTDDNMWGNVVYINIMNVIFWSKNNEKEKKEKRILNMPLFRGPVLNHTGWTSWTWEESIYLYNNQCEIMTFMTYVGNDGRDQQALHCPILESLGILEYTVNSGYLKFKGLSEILRYPYLDRSDLQNWRKNKSNNHISQTICNLTPEVRDILKILWKRREIAP